MRFSDQQFSDFNELAARNDDRAFAHELRTYRPYLVAHLDDDALTEEVRRARHAARDLGVQDSKLRARFVMIHTLLTPEFWRHPEAEEILRAATGTADIRFGDLCALIRLASQEAGCVQEIWW